MKYTATSSAKDTFSFRVDEGPFKDEHVTIKNLKVIDGKNISFDYQVFNNDITEEHIGEWLTQIITDVFLYANEFQGHNIADTRIFVDERTLQAPPYEAIVYNDGPQESPHAKEN